MCQLYGTHNDNADMLVFFGEVNLINFGDVYRTIKHQWTHIETSKKKVHFSVSHFSLDTLSNLVNGIFYILEVFTFQTQDCNQVKWTHMFQYMIERKKINENNKIAKIKLVLVVFW